MACFSIYDLTPISTTSGLGSTGNTRKYQQIDVYIYQCDNVIHEPFMPFWIVPFGLRQ